MEVPAVMKKAVKYVWYILWSNVIFGLTVYLIFTWLAEYSLLCAYLVNLALIAVGLVIDACMQRMLQSKKLIAQMRAERGKERNYRTVRWITDSFVSFKTALYLFYVFILVFSQVIKYDAMLVGANLQAFVGANDYSILFLMALDAVIVQFKKDRKKMKEIAEKLQEELGDCDA